MPVSVIRTLDSGQVRVQVKHRRGGQAVRRFAPQAGGDAGDVRVLVLHLRRGVSVHGHIPANQLAGIIIPQLDTLE